MDATTRNSPDLIALDSFSVFASNSFSSAIKGTSIKILPWLTSISFANASQIFTNLSRMISALPLKLLSPNGLFLNIT
jgi:hypothetical protein